MMKFRNVNLMCVFTGQDATISVASILTNPGVPPSTFTADIPPVSQQHVMSLANMSDFPLSRSIVNTPVQPCVSQPQSTCRAQNFVPSDTLTHSTVTATNFRQLAATPVRGILSCF